MEFNSETALCPCPAAEMVSSRHGLQLRWEKGISEVQHWQRTPSPTTVEDIPSSCTHASVTPCSLGREALWCLMPSLVWKPTSSNTRGSSNMNHCPVCVKGPWPCPEALVGMGQAMPSSGAGDQASKDTAVWPTLSRHFADLLFPSRPSCWSQGISEERLHSSSLSQSVKTVL